MSIDSNLLEILVCPECKGSLELRQERSLLACANCKLGYPIDEHGVPALIADEAVPLPNKAAGPDKAQG